MKTLNCKKANMAILMSNKVDFEQSFRVKEGLLVMIKESVS